MVKKTSFLPVGMLLACLLLVAGTTRAATYTVTNTTDCSTSGCGSLRQALMDAFNNAGADTINFASGGGFVNMGTLTLVDSVVRGNSSDGDAGGILNLGTLTLMNSTVSGNTAGPAG